MVNKIERMSPIWRWVLFLPGSVLAYILFITIQSIVLNWVLGPPNVNLGFYLLHAFCYRGVSVFVGICFGVLMIPKGKVLFASIFAGLIISVNLISVGYNLAVNGFHLIEWSLYLEVALMIAGAIFSIWAAVKMKEEYEYKLYLSQQEEGEAL